MKIANIVLQQDIWNKFSLALNDLKEHFGNIVTIKKLKGLSNNNFLIELDKIIHLNHKSKFVVLKILNLNSVTKNTTEHLINKQLNKLGVCPKILVNKFPDYYIIEYIQGNYIPRGYFNRENNFNKLITLLFKFHVKDTNFSSNKVNYFQTTTSLLRNIVPSDLVNDLKHKLQYINNELKYYPDTITFCHNDLNRYNFIVDEYENLWCIDFEYSGFSDVFFDLASLKLLLNQQLYKKLVYIYHEAVLLNLSLDMVYNKLKLFNLLLLTTSSIWYLYMYELIKKSSYIKVFNKLFVKLNFEFNQLNTNSF